MVPHCPHLGDRAQMAVGPGFPCGTERAASSRPVLSNTSGHQHGIKSKWENKGSLRDVMKTVKRNKDMCFSLQHFPLLVPEVWFSTVQEPDPSVDLQRCIQIPLRRCTIYN